MDVKSIRARRTKRRIVYRIVDEYGEPGEESPYVTRPKTTIKPLTMRRLIAMIDGAEPGGSSET